MSSERQILKKIYTFTGFNRLIKFLDFISVVHPNLFEISY